MFQLAQDRSGFKGEEILFIDNGLKHVDAAKHFGWQAFLYDSSNSGKSNRELEELTLDQKVEIKVVN